MTHRTAEQDGRTFEGPPRTPAPPAHGSGRGGGGARILRVLGELLVTLGVIVLLFVFYEVYVTDWFSAQKQRQVTERLEQQWQNNRGNGLGPLDGQAFARLYIPALGPDYHFSVVQGTNAKDLEAGPGHYRDTAMPGQRGNFAIAGHRVGRGAPFNDLDLVQSCDAIVVETADHWYVYRMLPKADEVGGWAQGRGAQPRCAKSRVQPLGGAYRDVHGRDIVQPDQGQVIDPIPGQPSNAVVPQAQASLITLTTCHPKFSARERLILHGVLVKSYEKNGDSMPPELGETD
ncbi:class E sortase [Sciscionella sediminilitoris]|uniref:class E sortase n=1 Tax=Sciscionella sediminilitoris TaxID=1445613 RepID=UPI000AD4D133|nr:class E sortase [Sciscionella sp. SE31]